MLPVKSMLAKEFATICNVCMSSLKRTFWPTELNSVKYKGLSRRG